MLAVFYCRSAKCFKINVRLLLLLIITIQIFRPVCGLIKCKSPSVQLRQSYLCMGACMHAYLYRKY